MTLAEGVGFEPISPPPPSEIHRKTCGPVADKLTIGYHQVTQVRDPPVRSHLPPTGRRAGISRLGKCLGNERTPLRDVLRHKGPRERWAPATASAHLPGAASAGCPHFHGGHRGLDRKVRGPPEHRTPIRFVAYPVQSEDHAHADLERVGGRLQFCLTFHVLEERLNDLLKELPRRVGRILIAPLVGACAAIEVIEIQRPRRRFDLPGNVLEGDLPEERTQSVRPLRGDPDGRQEDAAKPSRPLQASADRAHFASVQSGCGRPSLRSWSERHCGKCLPPTMKWILST